MKKILIFMTIRYLYHYLKTPIFELENQIKGK
jgi:hypothetical protein